MDLAKRGGRLSSKLFKGEGDIYGGGRISNFKSNGGGSSGEGRRANFPKNEVSPLKSILGQNISTETTVHFFTIDGVSSKVGTYKS